MHLGCCPLLPPSRLEGTEVASFPFMEGWVTSWGRGHLRENLAGRETGLQSPRARSYSCVSDESPDLRQLGCPLKKPCLHAPGGDHSHQCCRGFPCVWGAALGCPSVPVSPCVSSHSTPCLRLHLQRVVLGHSQWEAALAVLRQRWSR